MFWHFSRTIPRLVPTGPRKTASVAPSLQHTRYKAQRRQRARLTQISEVPEKFGAAIQRWHELNMPCRQSGMPDDNSEYLFYQTLIGAWPITPERLLTYMQKATREAKEHTSWTDPNKEYESALTHFIEAVMHNEPFLRDFEDFAKTLIYPGRMASLAQTLIKLTAPGIPDIYQGCELWDLHLVDPDNRTPVDFDLRKQLLQEMEQLPLDKIMTRMDEGSPKLWLIQQVSNTAKVIRKSLRKGVIPLSMPKAKKPDML